MADEGNSCAGILYTSRPRGDIVGTARFVDARHNLCCEINFGKVADATDKLLQRPDAFSGSIFRYCTDFSAVSNGLVCLLHAQVLSLFN